MPSKDRCEDPQQDCRYERRVVARRLPARLAGVRYVAASSGWVSGALFLITPDDPATIRGVAIDIPKQNVIFEFGLFVAALGRERIALCRYGSAHLDSDFGGFVHIPMGRYPGAGNGWPVTGAVERSLARWVKTL